MAISEKVIERLSLYRRLLNENAAEGATSIFSHELGERVGSTAAQVRRDIMTIGYAGHSKRGYEVTGLSDAITAFLDTPQGDSVILVGLGNLGRALLPFFSAHRPNVRVVASFDNNPLKTGRVIHGCHCYDTSKLEDFITEQAVRIAILAIPAIHAQKVTDRVVHAGVAGILNFAPIHLKTPRGVWVENIDLSVAMEKVAYLARCVNPRQGDSTQEGTRND